MKTGVCVLAAALSACAAMAVPGVAVKRDTLHYQVDGIALTGYLYYDDSSQAARPGVLVVHEWWGLNDYARTRAEKLARLGYVAFALDMYGDGKVTDHPEQAGQWAAAVGANPAVGRARFEKALQLLKGFRLTDPKRVAAIGYCFGGGVVLTMALAGQPLAGVVSFHGALPTQAVSAAVTARILVCNGAADPLVETEQIEEFQEGLDAAGADWQFINYGGARHGFTNPAADGVGLDALGYDPDADRRSWRAMQSFFDEIFAVKH